jgi:hypothetical protein
MSPRHYSIGSNHDAEAITAVMMRVNITAASKCVFYLFLRAFVTSVRGWIISKAPQLPLSAAGLIGFVILKPLCRWLNKKGWTKQPFTAQENTVMQTTAMAMTGSSASPWVTIVFPCAALVLALHGYSGVTTSVPAHASRRFSPWLPNDTILARCCFATTAHLHCDMLQLDCRRFYECNAVHLLDPVLI